MPHDAEEIIRTHVTSDWRGLPSHWEIQVDHPDDDV